MNVTTEQLAYLQARQTRIRNMCILAHVDHGKTTLSDHLIGSNALIHPKLMGELRYLDSRDDEQERGITMKSSSISLLYVPERRYGLSMCLAASVTADAVLCATDPSGSFLEGARGCTEAERLNTGYLVNLIDSPGHVDFCSEVSTAARLSDGALLVVDAVEGVCIQTHAVLRQAWQEKVRPCLFINKVDRLILELRMTPSEAYTRMQSIITHVNMIMSAFRSEQFLSEADAVLAYEGAKGAAAESGGSPVSGGESGEGGPEGTEDEDAFQPSKGNVAWGSAHDGWAFSLTQFADMYAEKLRCRPEALQRALWGEWHFSAKDKRVVNARGASGTSKLKPMFVQFALEPIWKAYSVCDGEDVGAVLGAIVKGRGLTQVTARALEHSDPRQALRAVLRAWLPLSEAVLGMAVACLPSPSEAAPSRVPHLLGYTPGSSSIARAGHALLPPAMQAQLHRAEASLTASSSDPDAPLVIYVSKMVSVPASLLPRAVPSAHGGCGFGLDRATPWRTDRRTDRQTDSGEHVLGAAGEVHLETCLKDLRERFARIELLVSPPLVAFRETVFSAEEAGEGASCRGTRIVEATTPNGACTVRVRALPLPGSIAALLDANADLIQRLTAQPFTVHDPSGLGVSASTSNSNRAAAHSLESVSESEAEATAQNLKPGPIPESEGSTSVENGSTETAAGVAAQLPAAEVAAASATSGLDEDGGLRILRSQLLALCKESKGSGALSALQNAWLLGPRRVGPNIMLSNANAVGALFSAPSHQVVKTSSRMGSKADAPPQPHSSSSSSNGINHTSNGNGNSSNADEGSYNEVMTQAQEGSGKPRVYLRLGHRCDAATALGMAVADSKNGSESGGKSNNGAAVVSDGGAGGGVNGASNSAAGRLAGGSSGGVAVGVAPTALLMELPAVQHSVESGIVMGFQMATAAGPLCDEPLWGVAFEVDVRLQGAGLGGGDRAEGPATVGLNLDLGEEMYGPFSGQVMTAVGAACRRAVMEADPRLVEAMYLCQLQASAEALSGMYAVLGRRRSHVLRDEMREGSDTFLVTCYLPVEASFGLADEMRRKSSGGASASLLLSHWQRLQVDPFFVPTTDEEREEWGEEAMTSNLAKRLIDAVRRRKGLPVEEKVVAKATKQRTLKRNV
ncbi:MAG: hypothetical protein WDW38_004386 [Sanguina aurantia]